MSRVYDSDSYSDDDANDSMPTLMSSSCDSDSDSADDDYYDDNDTKLILLKKSVVETSIDKASESCVIFLKKIKQHIEFTLIQACLR